MSVEAFGATAQRYAASLRGVPAVVADVTAPAEALAAAARRRREGAPFLSCVLIDEPRSLVAFELAPRLWAGETNEDARRRLFDALAVGQLIIDGKPQNDIGTMPPAARGVLLDVSMTGEGMLVRSWTEAEWLARLFGRRRDLVVRYPGTDPSVPATGPYAGGDTIVVWAAALLARQTAVFAYALKDFYAPVVIACHEQPPFSIGNVRYAAPSAALLERAGVVIDASIGGPATAIELARRGVPVAAASVTGASEYLSGVTQYEPWNWRSIHAAAQRAMGAPVPRVVESEIDLAPAAAAAAEARGCIPTDGPLVSVLVPTYNRRELLPRALDSVARQEYRNVETIVVNDGGVSVADIVAKYPHATLIEHIENRGITAATNTALAHAKGKYVTFCCDDDMLYPDAVGRWTHALERSKAHVANGNTMLRFDRRTEGRVETVGYRLIWKEAVEHRDSLFTPFTPLACCMLSRELFDRLGDFEDTMVMDMEFLLRVSRAYDYVHVDQPCVELEYDPGKGQGAAISFKKRGEVLAKMYERYPSDSADVIAGRRAKTDWHAERAEIGSYFEAEMLLTVPEIRSEVVIPEGV